MYASFVVCETTGRNESEWWEAVASSLAAPSTDPEPSVATELRRSIPVGTRKMVNYA
jgi:hypothetical protein